MPRYIDAEALVKAIDESKLYFLDALSEFADEVEDAPTIDLKLADVAPVVHGEWNVGYFHDRVCSQCCHPDNDLSDFAHDYCPNCGAKMDAAERR